MNEENLIKFETIINNNMEATIYRIPKGRFLARVKRFLEEAVMTPYFDDKAALERYLVAKYGF